MLKPSEVSYKPVSPDEITPLPPTWKQKWLSLAFLHKRVYLMSFLCGLVLIWIFIYYKLLHHHFELPEPLRELRKMFGDGEVKKRRGREDETEAVAMDTEKPCLHQFTGDRNPKVIHFAFVACGERYEDAIVSMKSIALLTNYNVYFHIFTDEKHLKEKSFDRVLEGWPSWKQQWLMYTVHLVRYTTSEDKQAWFKQFKPCASQSLFLAKILVDVDAVVYIDPDVLFVDAPEHLWNVFRNFNTSHIAALTDECGGKDKTCRYINTLPYPYFKPYGLSSSVMLMNLTRMRALQWDLKLVNIFSTYKKHLAYGDQDILNIYFESHKPSLLKLDCFWNYRSRFCTNGNICKEQGLRNGISALHRGGSFGSTNLQPVFQAVYETFSEYRFTESFKKNLLYLTRKRLFALSHSYDSYSCGNIIDAILLHLKCV